MTGDVVERFGWARPGQITVTKPADSPQSAGSHDHHHSHGPGPGHGDAVAHGIESFPVRHDPHTGRFMPGGGSGSGGSTAPRHGMGDIPIGGELVEHMHTYGGSAAKYLVKDEAGNYKFNPERQALHDRIVKDALAGHAPSEHPVYNVMGGGPAAGKSNLIDSGKVEGLSRPSVLVNADDLRTKLPEYNELVSKKDITASSFTHEEASYLAKRTQAAALESKYDVTLDGTGDSSTANLTKKIDAARAAGYQVHGYYVTAPTQDAVDRAHARGLKTGRFVPEKVIRDTHSAVSRVLPVAYQHFDSTSLFDTSGPRGSLTPVMSSLGSTLTVHDQGLWDTFQAKGGE